MDNSWIEIDCKALIHNVGVFKDILNKNVKIGVNLKANAYGIGIKEVFLALHKIVDAFFIINSDDAIKLRKIENQKGLSRKRIIHIGSIDKSDFKLSKSLFIELSIVDERLLNLQNLKSAPPFFLYLDTGLGREGIKVSEAYHIASQIAKKNGRINGFLTHYADGENVDELSYADYQLELFNRTIAKIKMIPGLCDLRNLEIHTCASSPTVTMPKAHYDMIRLGIGVYGAWTSINTKKSYKKLYTVDPKLILPIVWKVNVLQKKILYPGESIGYNRSYKTQKKIQIGVIPVGYYDGYPYLNGNKSDAYVLINGQKCPILGKTMMNSIIVNIDSVSSNAVQLHLTAILVGKDGNNEIHFDDWAMWAEQTNYNVMTNIKSIVPRYLINQEGD